MLESMLRWKDHQNRFYTANIGNRNKSCAGELARDIPNMGNLTTKGTPVFASTERFPVRPAVIDIADSLTFSFERNSGFDISRAEVLESVSRGTLPAMFTSSHLTSPMRQRVRTQLSQSVASNSRAPEIRFVDFVHFGAGFQRHPKARAALSIPFSGEIRPINASYGTLW